MGANLLVYQPEPELHWRLIRSGFEDFGDPDLMSHTLLHGYPLHVAKHFQVPLVLLGENSAFEYSGDELIGASPVMTREWFSKYAANNGMDAAFVSKTYEIPPERLRTYDFPDNLAESGVTATFMSYYFHWDSEEHFNIARGYGFEALPEPSEGTYRTYVGIDEKINRIHQYLKMLKFGYGRATDHACEDIRNGRLTRDTARELVKKHDLVPLSSYYTKEFIERTGLDQNTFDAILEKWRNKELWQKNDRGEWFIPGHLQDESAEGAGYRMSGAERLAEANLIESYFDRLWPLLRSITGEGVRQSHDILGELAPLQRYEFPSGEQVLDWIVPPEWKVREAYLMAPDGRRMLDVRDNNLHLLNYSIPFSGTVSRDELDEHLTSNPERPDAVPYQTSYYKPRWGFCISHNDRLALPDGDYKVVIDTEHFPGSLTVSEAILPGEEDGQVLFTTYTCHPSLALNELSRTAPHGVSLPPHCRLAEAAPDLSLRVRSRDHRRNLLFASLRQGAHRQARSRLRHQLRRR